MATSSLFLLDLSLSPGALKPAFGEVMKQELGAFSGDRHFIQMHRELLGRKREGMQRIYPSRANSEKIDIIIVGGGIAGLDTAYYLLSHPVVKKKGAVVRLFEMDDEVGGTAKEYAWEGIPYTNSAAYFYLFEPGHPIMRLYKSIGVLDEVVIPSSADKESVFIKDEVFFDLFARGRGPGYEKEREAAVKCTRFFSKFNEDALYPEVPMIPGGAYSLQEFRKIDSVSFGDFVDGKMAVKGLRPPPVPGIFREFVESYCYSSFGCSAYDTSLWQGLNWFASEFEDGGVGVLPGGNGRISTKLREKIDSLDRNCIRTALPVVDICHDLKSRLNNVTVALSRDHRKEDYETFSAPLVVLACPLTVTRRLLSMELDDKVRQGLGTLSYAAYVVSNVMINGTVFDKYWDTYCLDDYAAMGSAGESHYRARAFLDLINATWSVKKSIQKSGRAWNNDRTILTLYSPHPFAGQRRSLLNDDYCQALKGRIRKEVLRRLSRQGLKESAIADIRLARWGHAMLQARPTLYSGGVLGDLQRNGAGKGIYFAGCEVLGAPAIENCHETARRAVQQIVSVLSGGQGALAPHHQEERRLCEV
jgi:hypothetical protein